MARKILNGQPSGMGSKSQAHQREASTTTNQERVGTTSGNAYDPQVLASRIVVGTGKPISPDKQFLIDGEKASAMCRAVWSKDVVPMFREMDYPVLQGAKMRFVGWTSRMVRGSLVDERTPVYPPVPFESFKTALNTATYGRGVPDPTVKAFEKQLLDVEESQAQNIGPKSVFLDWPHDGPDKVSAVFSDKTVASDFNEDAYRKALEDFESMLCAGPKMHALPLEEAIRGMGGNPKYALDPTKNNGLPFLNRNWNNWRNMEGPARMYAENAYNWYMDQARSWLADARHAHTYEECVREVWFMASQRTVSKGINPFESAKGKRFVCAAPKHLVCVEKCVVPVIQLRFQDKRNQHSGCRFLPAWQPLPVLDKNVQLFLEAAKSAKCIVNSGDISSFDATVPPRLLKDIALSLAKYMDDYTARIWLSAQMSAIERCGCVHPTGLIFPKVPSSVKSGDNATQIMGSSANFVINRYGHHAGYYKQLGWIGLGDDFCTYGPGLTPDAIQKAFADFNMDANASKQFYEDDMLHFLQKTHIRGRPGGIGSVARVGGSLLVVEDDTQLEYDERNKYAYELQALARLENANFSPWFQQLVDLFKASDKNALGADWPASVIVGKSGDYGRRRMLEAINRPWTPAGMGVKFEDWTVNRVVRGEKLPPLGDKRYHFVYGRSYSSVAI